MGKKVEGVFKIEILNFGVSEQSVVAGCYPQKPEFLWQSWQEQNVREVAFSLKHGLCYWSCVFSPLVCPLNKTKCFFHCLYDFQKLSIDLKYVFETEREVSYARGKLTTKIPRFYSGLSIQGTVCF